MKSLAFFFFTTCFFACFSQVKEPVSIPGTKYRMIPPEGFYITDLFQGFYNSETGGSIMISEIPGPFSEIRDGMTAAKMKTQGMNLLVKETITFHGLEAIFLSVSQKASGTLYMKQIIVTGDDKQTLMLNGIYLASDSVSHRTMKESLFTLTSDNDRIISPEDASPFLIDVTGTGFVFRNAMAGALAYSLKDDEETYFTVANSLADADIKDRKTFIQKRILNMPHSEDLEISAIEPVVIEGMNGYEATVENKTFNRLTYVVILFKDDGFYYVLTGSSNRDHQEMLKLFRKTATTFRLKNK